MIPLLTTVVQAMRYALGFDLAVAVLCEDGRHVVPVFATGQVSPSVLEGVHVQALAAFAGLAGADQAAWPAEEPQLIALEGASKEALAEPETYEDAPLVTGGAITGMLRIAPRSPLTAEQRRLFFAMVSDASKAFEQIDAQRAQTRMVQDRLLQSEKMSSIGQLVSGVAHELNNPLTGIMGFSQLLLLKDLEPATRQQVETIYQEAERASKIVANLLTFARRREARKESANLNTLIERVLELRNYDLRVRNIDVVQDFDPDLPGTMVDTNQILQVLLNIIINAEQAMRPGLDDGGQGTLRISTRTVRPAVVAVSFADSGPGMSQDTLRRIFDPFFTTKEAGDGTGLGLTISYGIVEEHGGRIWAESTSSGSTFHVELPVLTGAPAAPSRPREDVPVAASKTDRRRILVVDDEEAIQQLLTGVLEMDGHDVAVANNGREALDRVGKEAFDLIITDIKMPVMGGPDMYRRLRDDRNPLAERVIFITGDTVAPDTRKFLQDIDNTVLAKPFRLRDVRESVASALTR